MICHGPYPNQNRFDTHFFLTLQFARFKQFVWILKYHMYRQNLFVLFSNYSMGFNEAIPT